MGSLEEAVLSKVEEEPSVEDEEMEILLSTLEKHKGWWLLEDMYKYKGFWYEKPFLIGSLIVNKRFTPKPDAVLLATLPKSGTTWFCALLFTIINRTQFNYSNHPLLTQNPHDCTPHIEVWLFKNPKNPTISNPPPNLISTHMPYSLLPNSLTLAPSSSQSSNCKIVYVCRDPLDEFVSLLHFANKLRPQQQPSLDVTEMFDLFCDGVSPFGSYWDHVLEYWNASIHMPDNVCFVRFEDMKRQPIMVLKKVAQFIGCPFSELEEENGVVQKIVDFCSFKSLTSFQVNSTPIPRTFIPQFNIDNSQFFRKGEIGDHNNYLTGDMVKRLKDIINVKFAGSGLDVFA